MPGAHELSGAIMRPSAFALLWPELLEDQWPTSHCARGLFLADM